MKVMFQVNDKDIQDIDTTILYTPSFNYNEDAVYFINNNCLVITKDSSPQSYDISDDLYKLFKEEDLKSKSDLSKIDEIKLQILSSLNSDKEVFVFFNVLTYLDKPFKEKIISYLKTNNKRIINYTTQIEETLLLDYLIVIHNNSVIMEGKKELVLQEEKIINKLGFNLPFIVELSNNLKLYGLVNKTYYNNQELVDDLWK